MRKRALTLLEVMVAMGLAALLLTTLFSFYRQLFITRAEIQKGKELVLQRMFIQARLSQIFNKAVAEIEEDQGLVFYTLDHLEAQGPALHFYYDHGIDPDPEYCGILKSILYLNKNKELVLKEEPKRTSILMENIENLKITFFDPNQKKWTAEWESKEALPPMVKLALKHKQKDDFVFFLENANKKITYKKK